MPRKVRVLSLHLFSSLIFLNGIISSVAQESRTKQPHYDVTVTLKLVQVYVTDSKGNPVADIGQEDFQLFDNGKLQKLTEFERHVLRLPGEKLQPTKSDESIVPTQVSSGMNRKFLLFFDFAFNDLRGILRAKREALNFMTTALQSTDEVGLISFDAMKGLTLHEYFTTEHQRVQKVIEGFGAKEVLGRAERFAREYWEVRQGIETKQVGNGSNLPSIETLMDKLSRQREQIYGEQVKSYSSEISDLAKALRYVPGIKHVIFFSGGVANSVLYGPSSPPDSAGPGNDLRSSFQHGSSFLRDVYEAMCRELTASNCLVHALNAQGVESSVFNTASRGDSSLRALSRLTGGTYYDNLVEDAKVAEKINNTTSVYYVLGYYVNENWDGKFHRLRMNVQRKGCKVFGQNGYFNPKPFSEYTELERILYLIDLALNETPLGQAPKHFPMITLPFSVEGKPNSVAMMRICDEGLGNFFRNRIEIFTLLLDRQGNLVKMQECTSSVPGIVDENAYLYSLLDIPPGNYDCRAVVIDSETGQAAVASSVVSAPEPLPLGIQLFPPLWLISQEGPKYIKGSAAKEEKKAISLTDIYPFDSTKHGLVLDDLEGGITKIQAVVRCSFKGISQPNIKYSVNLHNLDLKEDIPLSFSVLSQRQDQNYQVILVEVSTGELSPGRYSFSLLARDLALDSKSQVSRIIKVK